MTNLPEDILVTLYYVRWSCVRNLLIVRTGGLPPSLRSCRLRPERLALQVLQEHAYDSNGNITCDPLRCFEIRYNLLNLATEVIGHDPEDTAAEGTLLSEMVYYADGTRSGVRRPDDGLWLTRYVSSLICNGDSEFLYPKGVVTNFGYIDLQSGKMQYFLRDHLGSVRVIAEDRHTVISRTDYLPFGVRMSGDGLTTGNATGRSSWYGFSGKENEMWGGYDTADGDTTPHWLKGERYQHFGARAYDPVSCIFMQVDPMAEKYYGMTPYGYCGNSPIENIDRYGCDTVYVHDQNVRPDDNGVPGTSYTAVIVVISNGVTSDIYFGSSYPNSKSDSDNSTPYNTINEGSYHYNNLSGHKGGKQKGLNIVNDEGQRKAPGKSPSGEEITMKYVNVHKGVSNRGLATSRGSKGCITINPNDSQSFFNNFSWDKDKNVGKSSGIIIIDRTMVPAICVAEDPNR